MTLSGEKDKEKTKISHSLISCECFLVDGAVDGGLGGWVKIDHLFLS